MEKSEQQQFLEDLDIKKDDVLEQNLEPEVSEEKEETPESTEMKLKNRRERRLSEKLQAEREANIDLNARLQTISEARNTRETTDEADYLKKVERIYGNATPEAKEATELLKEALKGVHETARKEALDEAMERFEQQRNSESQALAKEEKNLDEMLENLEDEHNADFSDDSTRKGFLTLLERLSPKDKEGNIIEYADPETTWEIYESRKEKSSRAKDLASRSMVRSGSSQTSTLPDDSAVRYLKEQGII